jgi:hypothetical protein
VVQINSKEDPNSEMGLSEAIDVVGDSIMLGIVGVKFQGLAKIDQCNDKPI